MSKTLYEKVLDLHTVRDLGNDQVQLFVGLHLFHEATSAHAFAMLADAGAAIAFPDRNIGTVDHVIPTDTIARPFSDPRAEALVSAIEDNTRRHGLTYLSPADGEHGIVHVVGPEQGLTQPGLTLVCGDSHTATHGALGAIAFGIGTTQVRDVFATQTVIATRVQVRRIEIDGSLGPGVTAKDVILHIISVLGPQAGVGYAYEFGGTVIDAMSIEERMTVCNMAVEAGARIGYCNPDQRTYDYLRAGRTHPPARPGTVRCAGGIRSPLMPERSTPTSRGSTAPPSRPASPGAPAWVSRCPSLETYPTTTRAIPCAPPKRSPRGSTWESSRDSPSKTSLSTSPSSAPAPTVGYRISSPWATCSNGVASPSPLACVRSRCQARRRCTTSS